MEIFYAQFFFWKAAQADLYLVNMPSGLQSSGKAKRTYQPVPVISKVIKVSL